MAVIATAELSVHADPETAFRRFIDFATWDLWMPKGFRPLSGPSRALREGDRFKMTIGPGVPSSLTVIRLRPNKEICWKGGVPGVLMGEHSFFFEDDAGMTRMRSEEPFTGVLTAGMIGGAIEREATKVGERTLKGFAAYLDKH
jgi:hypothetical protein